MTKFAMTYATVSSLINNAEIRSVSPVVKAAYDAVNTETQSEGCSACSKRKKMNDAATRLISQLQASSDLELDRIKKALGVQKLVFPSGLTFIER
jgi:hypothetical protein